MKNKKAECQKCIMSQPNDESYAQDSFDWPTDFECARGGVYFPNCAHLCEHFGPEKVTTEGL